MKAEELLKKLKRLDEIPAKGYEVRGKPDSIQTVSINGELLVPRWAKRCHQYKINLLENFKKEVCEKQRYNCQIIHGKDTIEDETGKLYVSCEDVLNTLEPN